MNKAAFGRIGPSHQGVIAARDISEAFPLVCSVMPEVGRFEYKLSLSLKRVSGAAIACTPAGGSAAASLWRVRG